MASLGEKRKYTDAPVGLSSGRGRAGGGESEMPKDKAENIDRYKIRGGQLNEFEFHQNQGLMAQEERERFE